MIKNLTCKFAICVALLFGCLSTVALQAQDDRGHHKSGINGLVYVGQFEGGPVPGIWTIEVRSDAGAFLTSVESDEDGFFAVDLSPGNYVLTPVFYPPSVPGEPYPNNIIIGPPTSVVVPKNHFRFVQLPTRFGHLGDRSIRHKAEATAP